MIGHRSSPLRTTQELQELDKEFVWHPFTQMSDWLSEEPLIVAAGEGTVRVRRMKPAGGHAMSSADFCHGRRVVCGDRFD